MEKEKPMECNIPYEHNKESNYKEEELKVEKTEGDQKDENDVSTNIYCKYVNLLNN